MKESNTDGASDANGGDKSVQRYGKEMWGKETTWKAYATGEYNIKLELRETGWEIEEWINLNQDKENWGSVVNTVMRTAVSYNSGTHALRTY